MPLNIALGEQYQSLFTFLISCTSYNIPWDGVIFMDCIEYMKNISYSPTFCVPIQRALLTKPWESKCRLDDLDMNASDHP